MSLIKKIWFHLFKNGPVDVEIDTLKVVTVPHGTSILKAAMDNDIDLDHFATGIVLAALVVLKSPQEERI